MYRERADAARSRARVLAAAAELFAVKDPRTVTMVEIAGAAGMGRTPLRRRYPDVASIAEDLLDERAGRLRRELMDGHPPLGPGAPPEQRLAAFYDALLDLLDEHLNLFLGAETGGRRFATRTYRFWRAHLLALLDKAGAAHPEALADLLLAPLAPEVYAYQREQGLTKDEIKGALADIASVIRVPARPSSTHRT